MNQSKHYGRRSVFGILKIGVYCCVLVSFLRTSVAQTQSPNWKPEDSIVQVYQVAKNGDRMGMGAVFRVEKDKAYIVSYPNGAWGKVTDDPDETARKVTSEYSILVRGGSLDARLVPAKKIAPPGKVTGAMEVLVADSSKLPPALRFGEMETLSEGECLHCFTRNSWKVGPRWTTLKKCQKLTVETLFYNEGTVNNAITSSDVRFTSLPGFAFGKNGLCYGYFAPKMSRANRPPGWGSLLSHNIEKLCKASDFIVSRNRYSITGYDGKNVKLLFYMGLNPLVRVPKNVSVEYQSMAINDKERKSKKAVFEGSSLSLKLKKVPKDQWKKLSIRDLFPRGHQEAPFSDLWIGEISVPVDEDMKKRRHFELRYQWKVGDREFPLSVHHVRIR